MNTCIKQMKTYIKTIMLTCNVLWFRCVPTIGRLLCGTFPATPVYQFCLDHPTT